VRYVEHVCPSPECGVRLRTTLKAGTPPPSLGAVSVVVKCPSCRINFGLWLAASQASYVWTTDLVEHRTPPPAAPSLSLGRAEYAIQVVPKAPLARRLPAP
jgi:hypothetical protein